MSQEDQVDVSVLRAASSMRSCVAPRLFATEDPMEGAEGTCMHGAIRSLHVHARPCTAIAAARHQRPSTASADNT